MSYHTNYSRAVAEKQSSNGSAFINRMGMEHDPRQKIWTPDSEQQPEPIVPVSIGVLIERHPRMRSPVIDGIIRQGETCNIIAAPKVGKSWLAYGLALSVATGRDWLDTFRCESGRVLLIDNELHEETIAHRIPVVAAAMSIRDAEYRDRIDVVSLRGCLTDYHGLGVRLIDRIEAGHYRTVIVDAHYRMLPAGTSENDNAGMAMLYNLIDRFAGRTESAWLLIHHSSKGSQSDKAVTDVGAGAGSQSRAADTHLVLRPHEEPGHVVLDAAVRSWPPIDPLTLRWEFPVWIPAHDIDPAKLKGRLTKGEQRQNENDIAGMLDIVDVLRKWDREKDGPATPNAITEAGPYGRDKTRNLLGKMYHRGDIDREPVTHRGNGTFRYWLVESDDD